VITRRDLLKGLGAASVAPGFLAAPKRQRREGGSPAMIVAGQPAEILITPISALTTRITVVRAGAPPSVAGDGSLVERTWPAPVARISTLEQERTVRSGELTVVAVGVQPSDSGPGRAALQVLAPGNSAFQNLSIELQTGRLTFALGEGPLFGLGEGGPQFDRRGSTIGSRSGQGGYQLRTHGGRVPVQWLIRPSGWAFFVHQPYGVFDLTGADGVFKASAEGSDPMPLPLDFFVRHLLGTKPPDWTDRDRKASTQDHDEDQDRP